MIKGCVLLLRPRLREGMLRKLTLIFRGDPNFSDTREEICRQASDVTSLHK